MQEAEGRQFYAGAGGLAAIVLGMALVPLRGLTPASNLAFAFMALTIVIAELGGPGAALVTAVTSALSLDFFLTQPYLRLSIEDKHDVIALVGLAVCGLIAAALGAQREKRLAALTVVARHRELLGSLLLECDAAGPLGSRLANVPLTLVQSFPLAALVVRDADDRALAGTPGFEHSAIPETLLEPPGLQGAEPAESGREWDLSLPVGGGRIALSAAGDRVGWLDLWGDGREANAESRRALSDAARLIALQLACRPRR